MMMRHKTWNRFVQVIFISMSWYYFSRQQSRWSADELGQCHGDITDIPPIPRDSRRRNGQARKQRKKRNIDRILMQSFKASNWQNPFLFLFSNIAVFTYIYKFLELARKMKLIVIQEICQYFIITRFSTEFLSFSKVLIILTHTLRNILIECFGNP